MKIDQGTVAQQTARSLLLDAAGAEVVVALERSGVPSMILKGPTIVERLYRDEAFRPYIDIDLLIPEADLAVAEEVLRHLGYTYDLERARDDERDAREQQWLRLADGTSIDLHIAFHGIDPGGAAWPVLSSGARRRWVGGTQVLVPADGALALLVALHAADTPTDSPKPIEDLDRAAKIFTMDVWADALRRARATSSVEWMSAGLRRTSQGTAIADALGLGPSRDIELLVITHPSARPATWRTIGGISLARVANLKGFGPRLRFVVRGLFPSPAKLRASRGWRLPLVLAYPRHWWRALWGLVSGVPFLMKARRRG